MDLQKTKPPKRLDLQGIRALAIIVVLGFHFFPEYFPNGYLGVDQFFVLSGFLMCMLLKRAENQSTCSLISLFYSKRFKRILPLYLLFIFISIISLYWFFPDTAVETNQESANYALLFVSNRRKTDQETYFEMLSTAVDLFTHTWSLSVEIQFYFLVPFIFIFATKVPDSYQYYYYGLIGMISFVFYSLSSPTVAFNSVFARIWQFLIGMIVYLLRNMEAPKPSYEKLELGESDEKVKLLEEGVTGEVFESSVQKRIPVKLISHLLPSLLILITAFPFNLTAVVTRPFVTIATGILMLISEDNVILSNRFLTYIGDISYSLYLIHWPIYAYWKLTCEGDKYLLIVALISAVLLAILTYETYEKWYLKLSSTSIGVIVVILFLLNVNSINKYKLTERNFASFDNITNDMTVEDIVRMNHRWTVNDPKNIFAPSCVYESGNGPLGWCRHTGLNETGKYKMAMIGNSWTANHAKVFYQECGNKAKSILQGSAIGCEPLYPSEQIEMCKSFFTEFEKRIREEKPDYAFIVTRYISIGEPFAKGVTSFENDPIYQTMKEQMFKFISNIKYKLYILDSIPRIFYNGITSLPALLEKKTDPASIDKMLILPHQYEMARKRHAQLLKDCGEKCEMIDYAPVFLNKTTNTFRYYDERGLSYYTKYLHLTPLGIEHIRHVWTDVCAKL